jgi:hypothetical protein
MQIYGTKKNQNETGKIEAPIAKNVKCGKANGGEGPNKGKLFRKAAKKTARQESKKEIETYLK